MVALDLMPARATTPRHTARGADRKDITMSTNTEVAVVSTSDILDAPETLAAASIARELLDGYSNPDAAAMIRQASTDPVAAVAFVAAGRTLAREADGATFRLALAVSVAMTSGAYTVANDLASDLGVHKSRVSQLRAVGDYVVRHGLPSGVTETGILYLGSKRTAVLREAASVGKRAADKAVKGEMRALDESKGKRAPQIASESDGDGSGEVTISPLSRHIRAFVDACAYFSTADLSEADALTIASAYDSISNNQTSRA